MNYKILDSYPKNNITKAQTLDGKSIPQIVCRSHLKMAPPQFMSFLMGLGLKQICVEIAVHIMSF